MNRRSFLHSTGLAAAALALPAGAARGAAPKVLPEALTTVTTPFLDLEGRFPEPIRIARIEARMTASGVILRVTDADGGHGDAFGNERQPLLTPILEELVAPVFLGQDARRLEHLIDEAYVARSNYKLAGVALFNCIALVELAVWDLLARRADRPVHALLGPPLRQRVAVYLTRLTRETTAEQEVEQVVAELAATGARAVKVKIGGRMSGNADASLGRTDKLIPLLRKTLGPDITLYADANGSYDPPNSIRIGRKLEEAGFAFFEEPCPFQEFEATRQVAEALKIPIAGGEQDSSLPAFAWMIQNHALDILQPDILYVGGMIRALRVTRMAAAAGLPVVPHSPGVGPKTLYQLHLAAVVPNLGPYLESSPLPGLTDGHLAIPQEPGWGFAVDPKEFTRGKPLFTLAR